MEYADAPSGSVTLYNYKEPFMRYERGYGYQGVLLFDAETDTVQCHLCGEWFKYLPNHLHREHAVRAAEYKKEVGLMQTTALIGESQRALLIAKGVERFKNIRPGQKKSEAEKEKIRRTMKVLVRERQNLTGTCPEQLIERMRQTYHRLGRTPGDSEIVGGKCTIIRIFGSWKAACEIAGIPWISPGRTRRTNKIVEAELILWIRDNIFKEKLPTRVGYARKIGVCGQLVSAWARAHGGWEELCRKALVSDGEYRKVSGLRYSEKDLLFFLTSFKKNHGRNPSVSDCKRGMLPYASRYIYHWKSWKNALVAAGL